jgi:hypothetical protein
VQVFGPGLGLPDFDWPDGESGRLHTEMGSRSNAALATPSCAICGRLETSRNNAASRIFFIRHFESNGLRQNPSPSFRAKSRNLLFGRRESSGFLGSEMTRKILRPAQSRNSRYWPVPLTTPT